MKDFLEKVVKGFVDHPKDVSVTEREDETGATTLALSVNSADMGKVIGRSGKIAKALRLVLRIPAIKANHRLNLEIVEAVSPEN